MNWVELIGTTLIHFVWQGALLMGVAMGLLVALRKSSSQAKYLSLCGVFAAMAIAPVITAIVLVPSATVREMPALYELPVGEAPTSHLGVSGLVEARSSLFNERLLQPVVGIWLLGVVLLTLRVFGGFLTLAEIKRKGRIEASEELQARFDALVKRMGLSKAPILRISTKVAVPTVIGAFRGIVLLPASVATGMSTRMLETILAHELAHVARYDFLINALQSVIEVVLFYHPAVWWVSQRIREERENCCDDLVIATLSDRKTYARALTTLAELRGHSLAVRADGGELLSRIRRILGETPMKTIVSPIPVAILLGALVFVPAMQAFAAANDPVLSKKKPVQKTSSSKVKEVRAKSSDVVEVKIAPPQKVKEVVAANGKDRLVTQERTVPANAQLKSSEVREVAAHPSMNGPVREVRARDISSPVREVKVGPTPPEARSANSEPLSEVPRQNPNAIENVALPGQGRSGWLQAPKKSKDYLLYQLGQEIESLLDQRQSLLSMLRTGELFILDKEMQIEAHRKNLPNGDKQGEVWQREFDKLRADLQSAHASSEMLEVKLKINEEKLTILRKKLEEVGG